MAEQAYRYIIVGGGLAGASAIDGIRGADADGSILLIGAEKHLPYDRPPLSKKLWFGKKKVEDVFLHDQDFYTNQHVDVAMGMEIVGVDVERKTVTDGRGDAYRFDKLLLATGGAPRRLDIPGGHLEGICHYRYLDDYMRVRSEAGEGKTAVVIGGGFIGSEMAAALNLSKVEVTMVFPEPYLVQRVFPESLGRALQDDYRSRGILVLAGDAPASFEKSGKRFVTHTRGGERIESDILIVGIGISPATGLAQQAGLEVENGIVVNEHLQTSHPDIYAAGDNAFFPYQALGEHVRIEHWDNALNQGQHAGRNMAGADEPFTYMPYFFSDLFDFGYEAVGDVNTKLETLADWQKENDTGVIYYLREGKVRGAMMCNVWDKVDAARELIGKGERMTPEDLRGAIR
ncbi:MAG: FAD-dependent oxidoreductase [Armatimonadota bacterium]|nr:MAG: FAD-dependent oxidoreductase [Armatimonadota bacterium]